MTFDGICAGMVPSTLRNILMKPSSQLVPPFCLMPTAVGDPPVCCDKLPDWAGSPMSVFRACTSLSTSMSYHFGSPALEPRMTPVVEKVTICSFTGVPANSSRKLRIPALID